MIRSRLVGHVLNKREPKKVCTEMEEDLKLADILPSDRSDHCRFRNYKKLSWEIFVSGLQKVRTTLDEFYMY